MFSTIFQLNGRTSFPVEVHNWKPRLGRLKRQLWPYQASQRFA